MREFKVTGMTLPEAYHEALKALYDYGDHAPCTDYNTGQIELSMTMQVWAPLREPMISRLFYGGPEELEQYRQEMLDGILDFAIDQGKLAYTYHSRIKEQLPFIYRELRRNPDSRRAVIDVRDWKYDSDEGNSNPACLQHLQFFIRDGKLHLKVLFRSNDACKAAFMNAFALIMLQKQVAEELGVELGSYTHRANSFHCYERDIPLLKGYVDRLNDHHPGGEDTTTYRYNGEWDALMEEAKEKITASMEELKRRGV